ncbi:MAG: DNA polymerase III subunit beta [Planctomycetota bacterium]|jgi:DNA polymerase-3 subunit beta
MKILCDRNQLQEAFSVVAGIAPQKTPKPLLQNVLLEASKERVAVLATDLEISCRILLDSVKTSRQGAALLPARQTSALLKELTDPTVSLESKEMRCKLECGSGSFVLVGDDPAQFPKAVEIKKGASLTMPGSEFLGLVRKTIFAAAREESRYMINGVLLDCRDECLRMVATDGRRLALAYHNLGDVKDLPTVKVVVPIRALHTLARAISEDSKQDLTLTFGENQVAFALGSTMLVSQLLECKFPEYEVVIPKAAETSIEISRGLLEQNLRKVAVMSSGDLRMVRFNFSSSSLEMSAESSGIGRADLVMDVDVKGAGGSISFNPDYLLDALKVADMETIRLDMTDDSTPAKLTLGEAYSYVLMPISGS